MCRAGRGGPCWRRSACRSWRSRRSRTRCAPRSWVPPCCSPVFTSARSSRSKYDDPRDPHEPRARQPQDGVLGVHRLGVPAVHVAHLDLSGLQGEERRRTVPPRDPQHPVHVRQHVRPADVEPDDGTGARRGAARRHEVGKDLAVLDGTARARVPGRPGDRVHGVRAQGPDAPDEPVRLHVLRADGDARRARDGRRLVAADAVGAGAAGEAHQCACDDRRDQRPVLALRGRGLDRDLYGGIPHPMTEHSHPTAGVYLRVAAVLVILTVLEVGVFYVPAFHPVLVPVLVVLSAAKFTLVVMFYMHLKADSRVFTFLFGAPLLLAAVVMVALLFLLLGALTLRGAAGAG